MTDASDEVFLWARTTETGFANQKLLRIKIRKWLKEKSSKKRQRIGSVHSGSIAAA
jgi:hypothetical protein